MPGTRTYSMKLPLTLDAMSAVHMVTLSWTVQKRYLLQEPKQLTTSFTEVTMADQTWGTTMKTETGEADPDHNLIFEDIAAPAITICIEATLDCNTRINAATAEAAHYNPAPPTEDTATDLAVTPLTDHIADHPNTEAFQATHTNIIVGHTHDHPIGLQGMNCTHQACNPAGQGEKHTPRRTWGWRLRIHTQTITALMIIPVTQEWNPIL